jgi:hypothetical protein
VAAADDADAAGKGVALLLLALVLDVSHPFFLLTSAFSSSSVAEAVGTCRWKQLAMG